MFKALRSTKEKLRAFDQAHRFYFDRGCQRTNCIGARGKQNAPVTLLGEIFTHEGEIIGIIKDQQPSLLTSL